MSPLNHNPDSQDEEGDSVMQPRLSDMRRVSMSLAFSPARHSRRRKMNSINGWLKNKLGISMRRMSRTH